MPKLDGERVFSEKFTFLSTTELHKQEELRDFLYKYAHNLLEAREYLGLLTQVNDIKSDEKSELIYRIHGMSLQCFALSIRKLVDRTSTRSLQKLIPKVFTGKTSDDEVERVRLIYSHYKEFLDKGVAHQDSHSIKEFLSAFPDTEVIDEDMKHLENLYYRILKKVCTRGIDIKRIPIHDYSNELALLTKP